MTPDENKRFIQRFVEETINRKDLHAFDELVAKGFHQTHAIPRPRTGTALREQTCT